MAQQGKPNPRRSLPDVPLEGSTELQGFLSEAKIWLENLYQTPDVPTQVTGVSLSQQFPGVLVQWNRSTSAARYFVYRNTTGTFATAKVVGATFNIDALSVIDMTPATSSAVLYYWVVAENAAGVRGPLSVMTTSTLPIFTTTIDVQEFTSSGTWTLPTSWTTSYSQIVLVGGGGGGGNNGGASGGPGGGGGGGCCVIDTLYLSSNQTVTIGGGGAAVTAGTASTFGSFLTAAGGAAGKSASGATAGSDSGFVRSINLTSNGIVEGLNSFSGLRGGAGGASGVGDSGDAFPGKWAGGAGGVVATERGGGGGGSAYKGTGGAGGAGEAAGVAAAANTGGGGGGGGGSSTVSRAGASGGSGYCIVSSWRVS